MVLYSCSAFLWLQTCFIKTKDTSSIFSSFQVSGVSPTTPAHKAIETISQGYVWRVHITYNNVLKSWCTPVQNNVCTEFQSYTQCKHSVTNILAGVGSSFTTRMLMNGCHEHKSFNKPHITSCSWGNKNPSESSKYGTQALPQASRPPAFPVVELSSWPPETHSHNPWWGTDKI